MRKFILLLLLALLSVSNPIYAICTKIKVLFCYHSGCYFWGLLAAKGIASQSLFVSNVEALMNSENFYGEASCWNTVVYKRGTDTRVCHSCSIEMNMQPSFPEYVLHCYNPKYTK
ncbi:MAG: hypothetical protein LKK12_09860 [Bacteroidales bacterium]|nr:hypothetical protein [Bacteroidales bacterium]